MHYSVQPCSSIVPWNIKRFSSEFITVFSNETIVVVVLGTQSWLQTKWNTIVAPLVRELSMNKCAQAKSKGATSVSAAATAIAASLRANSLEISAPYESVACTALYVLLHRAISRDCPLTGQGKRDEGHSECHHRFFLGF